jgi:hypothetical protein
MHKLRSCDSVTNDSGIHVVNAPGILGCEPKRAGHIDTSRWGCGSVGVVDKSEEINKSFIVGALRPISRAHLHTYFLRLV